MPISSYIVGMPISPTRRLLLVALAALLVGQAGAGVALAADPALPPPVGTETPRVEPLQEENGLYHPPWLVETFLDLRDDLAEAKKTGRRLAVIFEQRGCPYCIRLHTEILPQKYINDYVRENFFLVQLNLWGDRQVTDFDGAKMSEKALAERWGVIFTPTIIFYKDDLAGLEGKWGRELEAIERLPLSYGRDTFYDLFVWVRAKLYERDKRFQRFHISRIAEREALKAGR
jgi:thioredoxin-related protein